MYDDPYLRQSSQNIYLCGSIYIRFDVNVLHLKKVKNISVIIMERERERESVSR